MKKTNATKQRKFLAARILSGLLLGAYLLGGYGESIVNASDPEKTGPVIKGSSDIKTWVYGKASAWGGSTVADGWYATAWGDDTLADGNMNTAFGSYTKATGASDATAFGYHTTASGPNATAFGNWTTASGWAATAWGYNTEDEAVKVVASGLASTAFGRGTTASGSYATAFGYRTTAGSNYATAFGYRTTASGTGSTAFGYSTTASGFYATASGYSTTASGSYATASGYSTTASGSYSTAFGEKTTASGNRSTAFGNSTTASGAASTAFGASAKADGLAATAFGIETEASGRGSTAWGNKSVAGGDYSTAFGDSSQALAENSLAALGGTVDTAATNSAAIGNGAKVTVADTVALGSGSVASREAGATDAYLKGTSTGNVWVATHNAIAVGDDDTATRQITGVAAGSKDTDAVNVAQVKKVQEALDAAIIGGGGIVYTAGNGIDISGTDINVKAGSDFTFDSAKTLQLVKNGTVSSGNKSVVTGGTVYTETRVSVDGNYVKMTNTAAQNLTALDTQVKTNAAAITKINSQDGVIAPSSEPKANEFVKGYKVYDYLNGDTLALGKGSKATGTQSIAIGFGNKVSGNNSGALGDPNDVSGNGSYAVGNDNIISGDNTFVLGSKIETGAKNAVVLGAGSEGVEGAVSVGAKGSERQIKNVADGKDDTDAATWGQVKKEIAAIPGVGDVTELKHSVSSLDSKVNKVGAGAAALAALHPIDTDSKFSMGAGFGNYSGSNAMALGLFYRPADNVMISLGGSMGNGENMMNVGVTFALDKGVTTSKAAMARKIADQEEKLSRQDAKIQSLEAENAKLAERLAAIEAKLGK